MITDYFTIEKTEKSEQTIECTECERIIKTGYQCPACAEYFCHKCIDSQMTFDNACLNNECMGSIPRYVKMCDGTHFQNRSNSTASLTQSYEKAVKTSLVDDMTISDIVMDIYTFESEEVAEPVKRQIWAGNKKVHDVMPDGSCFYHCWAKYIMNLDTKTGQNKKINRKILSLFNAFRQKYLVATETYDKYKNPDKMTSLDWVLVLRFMVSEWATEDDFESHQMLCEVEVGNVKYTNLEEYCASIRDQKIYANMASIQILLRGIKEKLGFGIGLYIYGTNEGELLSPNEWLEQPINLVFVLDNQFNHYMICQIEHCEFGMTLEEVRNYLPM